jgi:hypothetical protein
MTLQAIRRFFEQPVEDGITTYDATIPVFTDNQIYVDNDSETEFVLMRVNFGPTTEQTFCEPMERIRGSLVVEIYTPKGRGPGQGQKIASVVTFALNNLPRFSNITLPGTVSGRINEISGPTFTPLDQRPYLLTRLSCGFQAAYS